MRTSPSRFDRSALPAARAFYERELGGLRRTSRGWARTSCPFHRGSNKTAFSVNVETGGFYCFNCGIKGGSLIDFVMLRDKLDFKQAAQSLGAWRAPQKQSPTEKQERRQIQLKRERAEAKVASLELAERDLRLHYRNEIHRLEQIQSETGRRMLLSDDHEECWQVLSRVLPQLREAIAAYYLLSFATVGERIEFTLHPDRRIVAIQAVMLRGNVRDDHGIVTEVDFPASNLQVEVRGLELRFP